MIDRFSMGKNRAASYNALPAKEENHARQQCLEKNRLRDRLPPAQ